jgi:adenylate kinase
MPSVMLVALSGVPGTGKSVTALDLRGRGWSVMEVKELAEAEGLVRGDEVDIKALSQRLPSSEGVTSILVGHFSHLLPVDLAIVLRCHPEVLRKRLKAQGWPPGKVQDNVEAEAVDFVTIEAVESGRDVCEVDTTRQNIPQVADAVEGILKGRRADFPPGKVDWSEVILSWY